MFIVIYYSIYSLQKYSGWPSFRDNEVVWDNVRVLKNSGETVSADGTHLGHNIPDSSGNRYCINLVSVAGRSCDEWFGPGASSDDLLTTIVDLDVPEEFCSKYNLTAPCVYVHRSGPGSGCHLPGPPDACHRYVRVTYDSCPVYIRGAGGVDTQDRFDATTGVLKACSDDVVKIETTYWGPPAADPRPCAPQLVGAETAAAASRSSRGIFEMSTSFCDVGWGDGGSGHQGQERRGQKRAPSDVIRIKTSPDVDARIDDLHQKRPRARVAFHPDRCEKKR